MRRAIAAGALQAGALVALLARAAAGEDAGAAAGQNARGAAGQDARAAAGQDARGAAGQDAGADPLGATRDEAAARVKRRLGEVGESVDLLRAAHAKDPRNAAIAAKLGDALEAIGARREAEAAYVKALAMAPHEAATYAALARVVSRSPDRWQRQNEVRALFAKGAEALRDDEQGRMAVALARAGFERSVGRLTEARATAEAVRAGAAAPLVAKDASFLLARIDEDERALALMAWPETPLPAGAHTAVERARASLRAGDAARALGAVSPVVADHPESVEARLLRAQALERLRRFDEAQRELAVVLNLRPTEARAHRLQGIMLAEHGGALEAAAAEASLRRALTLEPAWDDLRALLRQVAAKTPTAVTPRGKTAPPPTGDALALYDEAQRLAPADPQAAAARLGQALAASPGFVDAAASLYALGGRVPPSTWVAIAEDGSALVALATQMRAARRDAATEALARPLLDKAVALGEIEALYQRALARAEDGDDSAALVDLLAYVASGPAPPRLEEARALRASLSESPARGGADTVALSVARGRLWAGDLAGARRALGGPCRAGLPAATLLELGKVAELAEAPKDALACHMLALAAADAGEAALRVPALERIAFVVARAPEAAAGAPGLDDALSRGARARLGAAAWARGRLALAADDAAAARSAATSFRAAAPPDHPLAPTADAFAAEVARRFGGPPPSTRDDPRGLVVALAIGAAALLAFAAARLTARFRRRTIAGALARVPDLFPEVAQVVGEIRHDLLKHRAGALGLLGDPEAPAPSEARDEIARDEIARALLLPTPASAIVATSYQRLERAAAASGVALRPLQSEPAFGAVHAALARAETLLAKPGSRAATAELAAIDRDLRERCGPALTALLARGPHTRLEPGEAAAWLRALAPAADTIALHVPAAGIAIPVPAAALQTIVANLVRNALAATKGSATPLVTVRAAEERDVTGRRLITLVVADSASGGLSLEDFERRDGQRGLGVVRDLVRRWGGHLLVRAEAPPYTKAVGAAFPMSAPARGDTP